MAEELNNPKRQLNFFTEGNIRKLNKEILKNTYIPKSPEELKKLLEEAKAKKKK